MQRTLGRSDYVRRDMALKNLIQPLAGEYGMHNNQPQRELLEESTWLISLTQQGAVGRVA